MTVWRSRESCQINCGMAGLGGQCPETGSIEESGLEDQARPPYLRCSLSGICPFRAFSCLLRPCKPRNERIFCMTDPACRSWTTTQMMQGCLVSSHVRSEECSQVTALSKTLAVKTLQLEMEYIFAALEDEAIDVAQGTEDAGFLLSRYATVLATFNMVLFHE